MNLRIDVLLNNTAYTVLGVVLCIIYYQVYGWWLQRRHKRSLKPLHPTNFYGLLLILFALITTLFSVQQSNQQSAYRECQARILQHNIRVQNDRTNAYNKTIRRQNAALDAQAIYVQQYQKLVHEGQVKHPDVKKILAEFDKDANTLHDALLAARQHPRKAKLQFITDCGTPK